MPANLKQPRLRDKAYTRSAQNRHCEHCGHLFENEHRVGKAKWLNRRFCSRRCSGLHSRTDLNDRLDLSSMPEPMSGCWLWTGLVDKDGYGTLGINKKPRRAHRMSWARFNGPIPDGLCVLHRCDVRPCINPDHLFLGTNEENTADKMRKGRHRVQRGSKAGPSKLTEEIVLLARSSSDQIQEIAARYGVSRSTMWRAITGKTWRHV